MPRVLATQEIPLPLRFVSAIRTFEMRKPPNSQGHAVMDAPPLLLGASMLLLHYLPLLASR